MGEGRIAGAQDLVLPEVHVQLLLERGLDVDLREDAEPFILERIADPAVRFLVGQICFPRERVPRFVRHDASERPMSLIAGCMPVSGR